jgi:N-acetylglucosaminyl-diphospho-decaprenol L-rhamnosyltransferase
MTDRSVAVVVVAHDSGALLAECVARAADAAGVADIVIVDNGSRDGSVERAAATTARVRTIRNDANPGFAVACNQGAKATSSAWLLFLNPDCLVEHDTIARLLDVADADPRIGLVGADVRDPRGQPEAAARRRDPDFAIAARKAMGFGNGSDLTQSPSDAGSRWTEVDAVSGALMLVRRDVFDAIGGFDEAYRLHCEDLDLCRRARGAGAKVVVAEQVAVTHHKGTSSRRRPWFVLWHKHRGMWRYYRKFDGARDTFAKRAFVATGWAGYTVLAFARLAIQRWTARA